LFFVCSSIFTALECALRSSAFQRFLGAEVQVAALREEINSAWLSCILSETGGQMPEEPPPSDIPNVFGMNQPQHMITKLYVEIQQLTESLSVWTKSESFPTPLFIAWNAAVTAWHLTDWLWASNQDTRVLLSKRYGFNYDEATDNGREKGLQKFQKIVREKCRELHICEEIANASKHMRRRTNDKDISTEGLPAVNVLCAW
jgi:hypothetical protein